MAPPSSHWPSFREAHAPTVPVTLVSHFAVAVGVATARRRPAAAPAATVPSSALRSAMLATGAHTPVASQTPSRSAPGWVGVRVRARVRASRKLSWAHGPANCKLRALAILP